MVSFLKKLFDDSKTKTQDKSVNFTQESPHRGKLKYKSGGEKVEKDILLFTREEIKEFENQTS